MIRASLVSAFALFGLACGHNIGDSCSISSDCSSDGSRLCDSQVRGGYCTIRGCDFESCPEEAVCVRFFPTIASVNSCSAGTACPDPASQTCTSAGTCVPTDSACEQPLDCASDEFCTVAKECAPLSIEVRYCMLSCSSNDDCREGYECRTVELMKRHGGEPVTDPSSTVQTTPGGGFCAPLKGCGTNFDCEADEHCDFNLDVCVPD